MVVVVEAEANDFGKLAVTLGLSDERLVLGFEASPERFDPRVILRTVFGVTDARSVFKQQLLQPVMRGIHRVPVVVHDEIGGQPPEFGEALLRAAPAPKREFAVGASAHRPARYESALGPVHRHGAKTRSLW